VSVSLLHTVARWANTHGSAVALAANDRCVSYAELDAGLRRRSAELARRGHGPGARLTVVAVDPVETVLAALAACQLGASVLLVDASSPAQELTRIVEQFGAEEIICGSSFSRVAHPLRPEGSVLDIAPALGLATSGVTGRTKVAQRDWESVLTGAVVFAHTIGLCPGDSLLCTAPLHHTYSFVAGLLSCLHMGATYVAPPTPTVPSALAKMMVRHRVTVLLSVPLLYRWYLSCAVLPRTPRLAVCAGERLPAALLHGWREVYGQGLCNHYGSTELGMLTFETAGIPGSAGRPLPGVELEVQTLPAGTLGEVIAKPIGKPPVLLDVVDGMRADRRAPSASRTGDLGWLAADGRLYLEGRASDAIDLGGEKVVPGEVEEVACSHELIYACAVVCLPDEQHIPRLCVFVEADERLDPRELRAFLCQRLAPHKVPSVIQCVAQLPRTATGKIRRSMLTTLAHEAASS
jgi:acyl-coenzyme A synthetase/AMP-(fatty) acid ligase